MSKYLLIESRDPFDSREVANDYQLAYDLAQAGNDTTLFLVQNGVLPVRKTAKRNGLHALKDSGVKIVCDEFSLRERGIYSDVISDAIETAPLDFVIEHLAHHSKTIWL